MSARFRNAASAAILGALSLGLMAHSAAAGDLFDREGSMKDPVEERTLSATANVALTSDYVFRGISQSAGHPAVQGGFDLGYGMLYAGTWASSLDFGPNATGTKDLADLELDVYGGIKPTLGPISLDIGAIGYLYPAASDEGAELDYLEFKFGGSTKPIDQLTIGSTVFYSPEYTGKTGDVWTLQSNAAYELPKLGEITPTLSATLGDVIGSNNVNFQNVISNGEDSYLFWNAGAAFNYDKFTLDLRYWDTNISDRNDFCSGSLFQCDSRFVATVSAAF
jgi:uncharacterized protein (TIGR02001 family)